MSVVNNFFSPFPKQALVFTCLQYKFLKTLWEKKKLLVTSNFFFSRGVFYPFRELSVIFIKFKIVVCKLFQFGRGQNLSFEKGLNIFSSQTTKPVWTKLSMNDPKEVLFKYCPQNLIPSKPMIAMATKDNSDSKNEI